MNEHSETQDAEIQDSPEPTPCPLQPTADGSLIGSPARAQVYVNHLLCEFLEHELEQFKKHAHIADTPALRRDAHLIVEAMKTSRDALQATIQMLMAGENRVVPGRVK